MAAGFPGEGEVISGMRQSCNMIIEIDLPSALKDGISFFESKNKVILSAGINGVLPRVTNILVILEILQKSNN